MSEQRKPADPNGGGRQTAETLALIGKRLWQRVKKWGGSVVNKCKETALALPDIIKKGCCSALETGKRKGKQLLKKARKNRKQIILFTAQFILSFASIAYLVGVVWLAVYSLLYRLEIPEAMQSAFCLRISLLCVVFTAVMLFTRRQLITRFCILAAMPFFFPIFLFNTEYMVLLIPLGLTGVITFFANGAKEGTKTILGTIYLMIYVLGAFCYFNVIDIVKTSSVETVTETGLSPSGAYRYEIIEVQDTANGNTYVSMEPNTYDIMYEHCTWYAMGYDKRIYLERPLTTFRTQWRTESREDITKDLLRINPDTTFTMTAKQMEILGLHEDFTKTYKASALSKAQRKALGICIAKDLGDGETAESLGLTLYENAQTITIGYETLLDLGLTVSMDVPLTDLSDDDLALLGVPEENDVLYINGQPVFRQYVAVLEDTFDNAHHFGYLLE